MEQRNFVFDYHSVFEYGKKARNTAFSRNEYQSAFSYHEVTISPENDFETVKETGFFVFLRRIIIFFMYIVVILLFPFSLWICLKRIHALERIVLMRLGQLQPVYGPGYAFIFPCIDKWTKIDLRPKTFTLSTSQLLTADRGIVEVETDVEYRVSDIVHYVMRLREQDQVLKEMALNSLTNLISGKDQEDVDNKRELLSQLLKEELNVTVLNWGLEILNVCMKSVKVLKAGEPVDAIGTLMCALRAATGQPPANNSDIMFPFPPIEKGESKVNLIPCERLLMPIDEPDTCVDILAKIKQLANVAVLKKGFGDVFAVFKFDIIGDRPRHIFCCFENGKVSVFEDPEDFVEPDVTLVLSEDNLIQFLTEDVSPVQAYLDGQVMVTGDWSLLRMLAKVFQ